MDKLAEVYAYPEIKELIKRERGRVRSMKSDLVDGSIQLVRQDFTTISKN